jgi:energy-coupling factor transporter ATP-binding protein EcfA2
VVEVISIRDLSFSFTDAESPILRRLNLDYEQGEFALVCGPTGSGKSTLLRALNGLIPHHSSGLLSGEVFIDGVQFAGKQPHEVAHLVGFVNQQPEGAFVTDTVLEELAYGMEQLGISEAQMRERISRFAALFGLSELLDKPLVSLSGGQQQRVAIASALIAGQQILLLDEPTSALDVESAHQLLLLLKDLSRKQGITVLLAEHRIERVLDLVDSVTVVHGDGSASKAMTATGLDAVLRNYKMVPPVIELGQKMGWQPLPLNVAGAKAAWDGKPGSVRPRVAAEYGERLLEAASVCVSYGNTMAVSDVSLELVAGSITAVVGPNGSGKSSLLWALQGSLGFSGSVNLADGSPPGSHSPQLRLKHIALVPQNASDLLVLGSIAQELADSDEFAGAARGTTAEIFRTLAGRIDPSRHPRDLSSGQQLALVLAIQLAKGAAVVLLDEPTRGLDYEAKRKLAVQLAELKASGKAILIASHDVEFVAAVADVVMLLRKGSVAATGSATEVLPTLADHSPQVWQVTHSALTVTEVLA